jgi:predicted transcriptional regulator
MYQRTITLTVRLSSGELHKLSALARKLQDSQSNTIRRALVAFERQTRLELEGKKP